jgi:hypothetical protein
MIHVGNFVAILQAKARRLLAEGHAAWWTSGSDKLSVNVLIIAANTAAFRKPRSHSSPITSNTSSLASTAEETTTETSLSPATTAMRTKDRTWADLTRKAASSSGFHPRQDQWDEHFERNGVLIVGRIAVGRATVGLLKMNAADRRRLRER